MYYVVSHLTARDPAVSFLESIDSLTDSASDFIILPSNIGQPNDIPTAHLPLAVVVALASNRPPALLKCASLR